MIFDLFQGKSPQIYLMKRMRMRYNYKKEIQGGGYDADEFEDTRTKGKTVTCPKTGIIF